MRPPPDLRSQGAEVTGTVRRTWPWLSVPLVAALVAALAVGGLSPRHAVADGATPGGTLRVAMPTPAYQGFDPTTSYTSAQFAVSRLIQRTLLTHRGLPGFEGTRLVPDLASGLPSLSADGLTWTFRIRPGVHYAPPLQDLQVTAPDFVRAFERVRTLSPAVDGGDPANYGPGWDYLPGLLDGFQEFADGKSSSISGAVALDAQTLQLRTTRPDRSFAQLLTLPFTAPIPPSPQSGPLGIATGHDFGMREYSRAWAGPAEDGFGPFQSATGPYMIEGADRIDYSRPANEQRWPAGFVPSWWHEGRDGDAPKPGRLVLIRNPSWDPGSDSVRRAYPDRIEVTIQPPDDPYDTGLQAGQVDAVIGAGPTREQLAAATGSARSRITRVDGNGVDWMMLNLLQPPFDDTHVRRAFAMALDREAMTRAWATATDSVSQVQATSTIVPNALVARLLSAGSALGHRTAADARAEMQRSRYWGPRGCRGAACRPVQVGGANLDDPSVRTVLAQALRRIGLQARFLGSDRAFQCVVEPSHAGVCGWGWIYDYPAAGSMFTAFDVPAAGGWSASGLGTTPAQQRAAGFAGRVVPSIRADDARCSAALPTQAVPCWARLDQWLTDKIVAVVPFAALQAVRMYGSNVTSPSMDQATGEYALDLMTVARG